MFSQTNNYLKLFRRILVLMLIFNMVSFLFWPGLINAQTETYATLTFKSKDGNGLKVENVNFNVYEQLNDINDNPVLGNRITGGFINETGLQSLQLATKNSSVKFAVVFYKEYRDYERHYIWNQTVGYSENKTVDLIFSSVKVIVKDKNNNLLKDQPFEIYNTVIDAAGKTVSDKILYWYQTTSNAGYKIYYFVPGNYIIKAKNKEYLFTVKTVSQTTFEVIVEPDPLPPLPVADLYGTLNIKARDGLNNKMSNVSYIVYEQIADINNKPVFGNRLSDGYISDSGMQTIKLKLNSGETKKLAFEFFKDWRAETRFNLFDQSISANETKDINLYLSSVKITIKDGSGQLLKDLNFDIYSGATDALGNKVAKDPLYTWQKTGTTGEISFYLIPNDYILRIRYPELTNIDALDYPFTINKNSQTNIIYALSSIKVSIKDINSNWAKNAEFKLYKKEKVNEVWEYKELGLFNTGATAIKMLYLPAGDYRIEYKDTNGQFTRTNNFSLSNGEQRDLSANASGFHFKLMDAARNPLTNLKINIYTWQNGQRQSQIFWGMTNTEGELDLPLTPGYYQAEIEGIYRNLKYQTQPFYIAENAQTDYEYILSQANIHILDNNGQALKNKVITFYYQNYDTNGQIKPGDEIGTFSTGYLGYAETYLPTNNYLVKVAGLEKYFSFYIDTQKLNNVFIRLDSASISYQTSTTTTNNSSSTNYNNVSAADDPNNLYAKDSDGDGLSNFEEYYIWRTDSYNPDSDNDGYPDGIEIRYGYNPFGSGRYTFTKFSYGKPRVWSPSVEKDKAAYLHAELVYRIGHELGVAAKDWSTLVNAYIYGGYTIDEIKNTLVYGPGLVHPTIPAVSWRKVTNYKI